MRSMQALVCVLLCLTPPVVAATSPARNNQVVQRAFEQLNSAGVTGLCHPESNEYSPVFPRCNEHDSRRTEEEDYIIEPGTKLFTIASILGSVLCVVVVAMASGLTVGLLPLDPIMLLVKMRAGATEEEKKQAAALLSVLRRRHLLLVSLLLLATLSSEALPIFLHHLMPGLAAVFVAVVLVLFFGKIAPSALCTGPKQIQIVSQFVPLVRIIMWLVYPVAYPIARLLDILVDEEDGVDEEDDLAAAMKGKFDRTELAALIRIQYEGSESAKQRRKSMEEQNGSGAAPTGGGDVELHRRPGLDKQIDSSIRSLKTEMMGGDQSQSFRRKHRRNVSIHIDEVSMMEGALQMKTKVALDIYTPLHKAFCVPYSWSLDEKNVVRIYSSGYSRIPVFETQEGKDADSRSAIRGILMTRQLIMVKPSPDTSLSSLPLNIPMCVSPKINLVDLMNLFQTGGKGGKGGHMALVCARPEIGNKALDEKKVIPDTAGVMGIITLEDVLEALLQEQIYDEMDAAGRIGGPQEIEVGGGDEYHLV